MLPRDILRAGRTATSSEPCSEAEAGAATDPEALFFVHIPKCAGSSFRLVLKRWFGPDALFLDTHDGAELKRAVDKRPAPARAIAGHIPFGLHEGLAVRPCYVSLVRDPLDRFVSLYRHARREPAHSMHPSASRLDLEGFYDFTCKKAPGSTVGVQCYFLSRERTFEAARAVIDRRYALLAPTERYADFVAALAERLGRQPPNAPDRNIGEDLAGIADARAALEPRLRRDHVEDWRLFDYVRGAFDARRGSLSLAPRA